MAEDNSFRLSRGGANSSFASCALWLSPAPRPLGAADVLAKLRWGCADHDDGSLIKVVLRSCQLFHLNANKESIVFSYLSYQREMQSQTQTCRNRNRTKGRCQRQYQRLKDAPSHVPKHSVLLSSGSHRSGCCEVSPPCEGADANVTHVLAPHFHEAC
ncbi:hypothetical protein AUP68_16546 [Ilyonectria robusta]